jgi:hypothetical protein
MKRSLSILMLGILLGALAYGGFVFIGTRSDRAMLHAQSPELLWLKKEFNLSDTEFKRISALHEAYMPHCAEMCRRIEGKNAEIKSLVLTATNANPEIQQKLKEGALLRAECQQMMLEHFFAVSRSMPPQQGQRYLAWVQGRTFLPGGQMERMNN